MEKIYDIGIIGAGPGGIASSVEAKKNNLEVILFEKSNTHSSTIQKYYKEKKRVDKDYKGQVVTLKGSIPFSDGVKESTLELFDNLLEQNDIELRLNTEIDSILKQEDGIFVIRSTNNQTYKARFVIISIGKMGQPNKPSYTIPHAIRKKINFNVNECSKGEKILVVGGGNSAVEYAVYLAEIATTTLNYRKSEFTRINDENKANLEEALKNGLNPRFGVDISSLEEQDSKVVVNFEDGKKEVFDRVVYAIGGVAPVDFLKSAGVEVNEFGIPATTNNHESNINNLFVVGDILFKSGGSIAIAINDSVDIINDITKRLKG